MNSNKQFQMYKNKNIFTENSIILNDKNNNIPYIYQRMYQKEKPNINNIAIKKYNLLLIIIYIIKSNNF